MKDYRFERKAGFWFVGVGSAGPYFDPNHPEDNWAVPLWRELFDKETMLPSGADRSAYISPCHGRESEFTFYGGFAYNSRPDQVPEGFVAFHVPPHTYAIGAVNGGREAIAEVYGELPAWAESQGRSINRSILWLEVYPERPVLEPDGPFRFEVWLPAD